MLSKIISLLLFVILLICIWQLVITRQDRDLYKTKVADDFKEKYRVLEQRLQSSERIRVVLVHRLDSIDNSVQSLVSVNRQLDSSLRTVKGAYIKRSTTELELEMIKRFNANK